MTYPVDDVAELTGLETLLIHHFDAQSTLMQGQIPAKPASVGEIPAAFQIVQVMADEEIADKLDPAQRLPRQAGRYAEIVGHFIAVKNSDHVARAMHAHFRRLSKYHAALLKLPTKHDEAEE
jgi:hypothetical protein